MKLANALAALAILTISSPSFAQTPNMDREKDAIYSHLYKQGMSIAPTDIYIMATTSLKNEICGEAKMPRSVVDAILQVHGQSAEMPQKVLMTWVELMKRKFKTVLVAYPNESQAFCK